MHKAAALWREATAEGTHFSTSIYNSLLYLSAGGEGWERLARGIDAGIKPLPIQPLPPRGQKKPNAQQQQADGAATDGGEQAEAAAAAPADAPPAEESPMVMRDELISISEQLWAAMQAAGLQPDHGTYLALARVEAIKGNAGQALHWVRGHARPDHACRI